MSKEREREVLAESNQRVRLVRGTGPEEVHHFVVEVIDDDGGVAESTRYAHDDFPLAANDYNRRIVETLDSSVAEVALQVVIDMSAFKHEALAVLLHDDFVQLDHRPIGYPDLDKAGFLDAVVAQSDIVRVWLTQSMHAATSVGSMATGDFWTLNYGQWTPLTRGIYINVLDGRQLARVEIYPEDQLDDAIERFGRLTWPGVDT